MKWYEYLWIGIRCLLFAILWYIVASVIFGLILGILLLINGEFSNDPHELGHLIQDVTLGSYAQYMGVLSLAIGVLISGFQHFRYYKKKQRLYTPR